MKYVWTISTHFNEYDQHGGYLIAIFLGKPTKEELQKTFPKWKEEHIKWVLSGGGRHWVEDAWDILKMVKTNTKLELSDF